MNNKINKKSTVKNKINLKKKLSKRKKKKEIKKKSIRFIKKIIFKSNKKKSKLKKRLLGGNLTKDEYINEQVNLIFNLKTNSINNNYFRLTTLKKEKPDINKIDLYHVLFEDSLEKKIEKENYLYYSLLPNFKEGIKSVSHWLSQIDNYDKPTRIKFYKIELDLSQQEIDIGLFFGNSYSIGCKESCIDLVKTKFKFDTPKFDNNDLKYETFRKYNYEILKNLYNKHNIPGFLSISINLQFTKTIDDFLTPQKDQIYNYEFTHNEFQCLNSFIKKKGKVTEITDKINLFLKKIDSFIYNKCIYKVDNNSPPNLFLNLSQPNMEYITNKELSTIKILTIENLYFHLFYDSVSELIQNESQNFKDLCKFLAFNLCQAYNNKVSKDVIKKFILDIKLPLKLKIYIDDNEFKFEIKGQKSISFSPINNNDVIINNKLHILYGS